VCGHRYGGRAGTQTAYSFGDDPQQLPAYGNLADRTFYETGDVYANYAHRVWVDGVARLARSAPIMGQHGD